VGVSKAKAVMNGTVGLKTPVAGKPRSGFNSLRELGDFPVSKAFGLGVTGSPRGIPGNGRQNAPRFENPRVFV